MDAVLVANQRLEVKLTRRKMKIPRVLEPQKSSKAKPHFEL
jgi:hypothetical protein